MLFVEFNGLPAPIVTESSSDKKNPVVLVRRALIFVEGDHTDSRMRGHSFDRERVIKIFNNTNKKLEQGGVIPVILDHDRSAKSVVGSIQKPLVLRQIVEDDLKNLVNGDKLSYLIDKIGIFSDEVILKDQSIIEAFLKDTVRTISPGIDLRGDIIREVSIVATPSIPGLSLYSNVDNNEDICYFNINNSQGQTGNFMAPYTYGMIYTLNEALAEKKKVDNEKSKFLETAEVLWDILVNIKKAGYDENEALSLIVENLQQFVANVLQILNVSVEDNPQPMVASNVPVAAVNQSNINSANYSSVDKKSDISVVEFLKNFKQNKTERRVY
ncbi:MAG: hypothetical protein D6735_04225 [Acidobacteria bacterium]|jgi:hypothetical protein|nr:MAG: hypothetical protein D6735_04225 [Acidobacteriota bacterium]